MGEAISAPPSLLAHALVDPLPREDLSRWI
jgi:hypothetical protein